MKQTGAFCDFLNDNQCTIEGKNLETFCQIKADMSIIYCLIVYCLIVCCLIVLFDEYYILYCLILCAPTKRCDECLTRDYAQCLIRVV